MLEALSDPGHGNDFPGLSLDEFISELLAQKEETVRNLAWALGAVHATEALDPGLWRAMLSSRLPHWFAKELLKSAAFHGNWSWCTTVENWPATATWIDCTAPEELWKYVSGLKETLKKYDSASRELLEEVHSAARALREWAEGERFSEAFHDHQRWLTMQAIQAVVEIDPSQETLAWLERECGPASSSTRGAILDAIPKLVSLDPARAARLFRTAATPTALDETYLGGEDSFLSHHAVGSCIMGNAILKSFPSEFLPVALELAEPFWLLVTERRSKQRQSYYSELREGAQASGRLSGILEDHPEWDYWRAVTVNAYVGLLRGVHESFVHLAETRPSFFASEILEMVRNAPLAAIHSIFLDVALEKNEEEKFTSIILEKLCDPKLYRSTRLLYWIEQGLERCWKAAPPEIRRQLLKNIKGAPNGAPSESDFGRAQLLCRLPEGDLSEEDVQIVRQYRSNGDGDPLRHPKNNIPRPVSQDDDTERWLGKWPSTFDRDRLRRFRVLSVRLLDDKLGSGELAKCLSEAMQLGSHIVRELLSCREVLRVKENLWVLDRMRDCLERHLSLFDETVPPPAELVCGAAELALQILSEGPGGTETYEISGGDTHIDPNEPWSSALQLADVALTYPPYADNAEIQRQFESLLENYFLEGDPVVQRSIIFRIRPWHWFRTDERRALYDRLAWKEARHGAVIKWALQKLGYHNHDKKEQILRCLLKRSDIESPEALAEHLAECLGSNSMLICPSEQRSTVARLAREAAETPDEFPFLRCKDVSVPFLKHFIFGMQEELSTFTTSGNKLVILENGVTKYGNDFEQRLAWTRKTYILWG